MTLVLKSTRGEFELSDPSGYRFKIITEQETDGDRAGGWRATCTLSSQGHFTSAEGAIVRMQMAAEAFVRMLKEARDAES